MNVFVFGIICTYASLPRLPLKSVDPLSITAPVDTFGGAVDEVECLNSPVIVLVSFSPELKDPSKSGSGLTITMNLLL